jgi:DNA-binding transcriptional ArsR family regulator
VMLRPSTAKTIWKPLQSQGLPSLPLQRQSAEPENLLTRHVDITKIFDMKNDYSQTIPPAWQAMSKIFVALGDEHRQRILLLFEPGERLNVGQIAEVSTLARSTVSHHLKILHESGVLASEKIGKEVWFWINRDVLATTFSNVLDYLKEST